VSVPDEPFRRRIDPKGVSINGRAVFRRAVARQRNADMPQLLQAVDDPRQLDLGVRTAFQVGHRGIDKFARQSDDAVVLGLNARPRLQNKASDIGRETEHQHQRNQQVQARPQGKFPPHPLVPLCRCAAGSGESVDRRKWRRSNQTVHYSGTMARCAGNLIGHYGKEDVEQTPCPDRR
jgi:hypothetical protein